MTEVTSIIMTAVMERLRQAQENGVVLTVAAITQITHQATLDYYAGNDISLRNGE